MPAPVAARLRLALATLLLFSGRPRPAVVEIRSILTDTLVPGSLRAPAELCLVWAMLALDDWSGAASQVEVILSGGGGRDKVLSPALAALGAITWRDGIVADALALTRAAVLRSDHEPPAAGDPFGRACLARMLTSLGELDEASQPIESAQAGISAAGDTLWSAAPAIAAARVDLAAGRIDAASASAHAAVDLATQLGTSCFLPPARLLLAEVALLGGELSEAAAHLECGNSGCRDTRTSARLLGDGVERLVEPSAQRVLGGGARLSRDHRSLVEHQQRGYALHAEAARGRR